MHSRLGIAKLNSWDMSGLRNSVQPFVFTCTISSPKIHLFDTKVYGTCVRSTHVRVRISGTLYEFNCTRENQRNKGERARGTVQQALCSQDALFQQTDHGCTRASNFCFTQSNCWFCDCVCVCVWGGGVYSNELFFAPPALYKQEGKAIVGMVTMKLY